MVRWERMRPELGAGAVKTGVAGDRTEFREQWDRVWALPGGGGGGGKGERRSDDSPSDLSWALVVSGSVP